MFVSYITVEAAEYCMFHLKDAYFLKEAINFHMEVPNFHQEV